MSNNNSLDLQDTPRISSESHEIHKPENKKRAVVFRYAMQGLDLLLKLVKIGQGICGLAERISEMLD